jgi:hypothetical protein
VVRHSQLPTRLFEPRIQLFDLIGVFKSLGGTLLATLEASLAQFSRADEGGAPPPDGEALSSSERATSSFISSVEGIGRGAATA